jgi:AraC family transcriptional regulator
MGKIDFGSFVVRECTYSPGLRQPRHRHNYSNVSVVTGGEIAEATDAGDYVGRPASVVVKSAGCEHENRISGFGARTLSIEVPPDSSLAPMFAAGRWSWSEEPEVVRAALALRAAFETGIGVETAATQLIGIAIARLPPATSDVDWLETVKRVLHERLDVRLRFDRIAADVGLHPVYLSRAFRKRTGLSMTEYVRSLRIRRARHLLSSSRHSIVAIAGESGFSDASHLCRTFHDTLGVTPRDYRKLFS